MRERTKDEELWRGDEERLKYLSSCRPSGIFSKLTKVIVGNGPCAFDSSCFGPSVAESFVRFSGAWRTTTVEVVHGMQGCILPWRPVAYKCLLLFALDTRL